MASPSAQSTSPSANMLGPGLELLGQLGVDREALGRGLERLEDRVDLLAGDAGVDVGQHAQGRRLRLGPRALGRRVGAGLLERGLQPVLEVVERGLGLLDGDVAPLDQRLGVELADRAPGVDALVHQRLGVARVVALVVTVAAVAHHVDHDVLVELLAVGERQPGHPHAGLGVVAVHVEDRRLHHLGHVGRVLRRAGRVGRGGEAELVVDDQVDRAADAVALDHRQVERLGHDALAGEGGVAVDQDRQHRVAPGRIDEVHLGPGHALDDRVDGLEVRRVGRQLDLDGVAARG